MFILDDIFIKPLVTVVDVLHSMAVRETYDVADIQDELKETRLLYELGDISRTEYEERREELEAELEFAERMREKLLEGNVEVVSG